MIKYILIIGIILLSAGISIGQNEKLDKIKAIELRSNSRDITPVRKTNMHNAVDVRQNKAITNTKRQEMRQKRAMYQKKRMMQNRKRTMQMQKMMRNKATMQRNRR